MRRMAQALITHFANDWVVSYRIARLILGQTLTSGRTVSSTNALGKVHNRVRRDLLIADAKQIAQTITKQIILPYLQLNVDPSIDESSALALSLTPQNMRIWKIRQSLAWFSQYRRGCAWKLGAGKIGYSRTARGQSDFKNRSKRL